MQSTLANGSRRAILVHGAGLDRLVPAARTPIGRAQEGRLGRGNHRVPAGQRPARALVPRSDAAQGHRQPDGPGRLAARGLRRDGHGPPLEHMVFKGTPTHRRHPRRDERTRGPVQRLDRRRPDQLLRDLARHRPETSSSPSGSRPTAWSTARSRPEDLATEFSVVRNEFESGENSPNRVLSQRMAAVAYEWHNYGKSTIGNRSDIERVPVDNLRAFYKKFYQPDNAMLVVAGKFDEKKALEYITKYFGTLPRPDRKLPSDLHRRAGARRRAVGHACAGWETSGWSGCSITSRPPRMPSTPRSRSWAASSIPSPRGGSTRPWSSRRRPRQRFGQALGHSRPGHDRDRRRGQHQGPGRPGKGPGRHALGPRRGGRLGRHPGGSRSRPPEDPQEPRAGRRRSQPHRRRALGMGRPRRLAALFPQPRPDRAGHARAGQGDRREVFHHQQPDRRLFRSDRQARADADPGRARYRQAGGWLQGPRRSSRSRARPPTSPRWPSRHACSAPSRSAESSWPSFPRKPAASRSSCG